MPQAERMHRYSAPPMQRQGWGYFFVEQVY